MDANPLHLLQRQRNCSEGMLPQARYCGGTYDRKPRDHRPWRPFQGKLLSRNLFPIAFSRNWQVKTNNGKAAIDQSEEFQGSLGALAGRNLNALIGCAAAMTQKTKFRDLTALRKAVAYSAGSSGLRELDTKHGRNNQADVSRVSRDNSGDVTNHIPASDGGT